jgi:P pilus assembly chaperone PapD
LFDPTTFYLSDSEPKATLRIFNNEDFPIRWTASLVRWRSDEEGNDKLQQTDEIAIEPSLIELLPHAGGALEIEATKNLQDDVEGTYRVIMTSSEIRNGQVAVTYSYSLPIFIRPKVSIERRPNLSLRTMPGELRLTVHNDSNVHEFVDSVKVEGYSLAGLKIFNLDQSGMYILPKSDRTYTLAVSERDCTNISGIALKIELRNKDVLSEDHPVSMTCRIGSPETGFKKAGSVARAVPKPD